MQWMDIAQIAETEHELKQFEGIFLPNMERLGVVGADY